MGVQLFKGRKSQVFDEYSYQDRLNEGWSLEDPALSVVETIDEDEEVAAETDDEKDITENWVHPGDLPDNPTDQQVAVFAYKAAIPYAAMKNSETLKRDLGYENQG